MSERKDRLLQTRVPEKLETTLKDEARRRRTTVSQVIRSILEDTFHLVDGVVANAAATGVPVVTLLISGRPLVVAEALDASDAFMAVWLPGTEGDGIADVLFGDHAPTGKLSFSWPRSADQHPINVGDEDYDPLFAFGFGLSW